ncbi:hypothetical protein EXIGLDRAFT_71311 [Exidia glandulosa HHB12029]|uniref:Uncharacterized protein n=1 Tax=Exidia glandulosa HHB12029 TaxID=1314781 RepID=A0A166MJC1_EXIGL|nr:hypothetical protein EXIGLDRAFT_71311 [Exidia glandulosa HHB12029]
MTWFGLRTQLSIAERNADSSTEEVDVPARSASRADETREASAAVPIPIAGTFHPAAPPEASRGSQPVAERSRANDVAKPTAPVAFDPTRQQKSRSPLSAMSRDASGTAVLAKLRVFPRSLVTRLWGKKGRK